MAWSGFGWLGYVVIFGMLFGARYLFDDAFGQGYSREHPIIVIRCALVASSVAC